MTQFTVSRRAVLGGAASALLVPAAAHAATPARHYDEPKSRSKPSRYSSENDVLIEKSVKYTDFFLLSIVYI